MSQNSIVISTTPPLPGLTLITALNQALDSLGNCFSGETAPSSPVAGQLWFKPSTQQLSVYGSSGWAVLSSGAAFVPTSRTIATSGLATGGGDMTADRTFTVGKASDAEIRAGTEDGKATTPKGLADAQALVTLTDGASIAIDFATGENFQVTLGGNRVLPNPSNIIVGKAKTVMVKQDVTGGRTLTFGTYYLWAGGSAPTLSTGSNAIDLIGLLPISSTQILAVIQKAFA